MIFGTVGLILVMIVFFVLAWTMSVYNKLVRLDALTSEGWSGIDVQLKRRYDLIPNLVATVKQYSIHEKETLEKVTSMRSISMNATDMGQKMEAEGQLSQALKTLFAVSENYPDLKANENFLSLQKDLGEIEKELQLARRYYNGAARNYNIAITVFPANMVAKFAKFESRPYFKVTGEQEREAPKVDFK